MHSRIRRYFRQGRLSQLVVFDACVRYGSFTRAARELHLAQPTISAQVRKLSDAIGAPLFEQIGKRMYPTEVGRCVHAACAEVLGAFTRLDESLARLRAVEAGRLALAASTSCARLGPRLAASFACRHPALEVALEIHNRTVLLERLARDADDLYLLAHPPESGVVAQRILSHRIVVLAAPGHALAGARSIGFDAIAREPIVMREPGSGTRALVEGLFRERGHSPQVRLELPTNEAVEEAVRAGAGIAIAPMTEASAGGLVELDVRGFPVEGHLFLCYPVGKALPPAARAFLDFARRELVDRGGEERREQRADP